LELAHEDRISRYLFSDRHYAATKRLVKTGAFNPSPYDELSVGHTTGLETVALWQLGEVVRAYAGATKLHARADVDVRHATEKRLRAIRDDKDYERHTNVVGWPVIADEDIRKRIWKGLATHLADHASLELPPVQ